MVQMGTADQEYRGTVSKEQVSEDRGGGAWDKIFVDGSMRETVLLPQFWGMYGTQVDGDLEKRSAAYRQEGPLTGVPGAREQVALPGDQILHSGNAGIMLHRTAQIEYDFGRRGASSPARSPSRSTRTSRGRPRSSSTRRRSDRRTGSTGSST